MDVMLRFPFQDEVLTGPAPPSLPASALMRWRPLVPVTILGPAGIYRDFGRAVLDPAADDSVFPLDTAGQLRIPLRPSTGHGVRWRGQLHPLRFGDATLLLTDNGTIWRWQAVVGFSPAPIRYPILGQAGCLQFLDARFLGADLAVELETNSSYPGTRT
jgi:hypothetical protein